MASLDDKIFFTWLISLLCPGVGWLIFAAITKLMVVADWITEEDFKTGINAAVIFYCCILVLFFLPVVVMFLVVVAHPTRKNWFYVLVAHSILYIAAGVFTFYFHPVFLARTVLLWILVHIITYADLLWNYFRGNGYQEHVLHFCIMFGWRNIEFSRPNFEYVWGFLCKVVIGLCVVANFIKPLTGVIHLPYLIVGFADLFLTALMDFYLISALLLALLFVSMPNQQNWPWLLAINIIFVTFAWAYFVLGFASVSSWIVLVHFLILAVHFGWTYRKGKMDDSFEFIRSLLI